jgi:peptidoglycan hydrolase CwlO-like protein
MNEENLKKIISKIPEEELPAGHSERFLKRLEDALPLEQKLWNFQRFLIAASVAALICGTLFIYAFYNRFSYDSPLLNGSPGKYYETELYLKGQLDSRMKKLAESEELDNTFMNDLKRTDESMKSIRQELKKNPGDMRLISAVFESYQVKIDFLDEVLKKQNRLSDNEIK